MRKMIVAAALAIMVSASALAGNAPSQLDVSGLTEAQRIAIMDQVAKARQVAETKPAVDVSPEKVKTYADVGIAVGKALAGAVKELGVEANSFATTPLGMVTVGLIIWNVAGDDVAAMAKSVFIGIPLVAVWLLAWFYIYRRQCLIYGIEYRTEQNEAGKTVKIKDVQFYDYNKMNSCDKETLAWYRFFTIFFGMIGFLIIILAFF
jgi:hypothetical protein